MCDGDYRLSALVPIDPICVSTLELFDPTHPEYGLDDQGRPCLRLDRCMVPAIQALWRAGIPTIGCCCGHGGEGFPVISLERTMPRHVSRQ